MRLYIGNTNSPVQRRLNISHFCLDPVRPAYLPDGAVVLLDSGAFGDVRRGRLTLDGALERQLAYEENYGFVSERIVSYDLLIDEQLDGNRQIKSRWNEKAGWEAVDATIDAAFFLANHRADLLPRQLVLSCQGVTTDQYVKCVREILAFASPSDCIGLGGWCIVGQQRHLAGLFWETMREILPMIADRIRAVHIFGVSYVNLLRQFACFCSDLGLESSTDTTRFYFELSRGLEFDIETGKSIRTAHNGENLAADGERVRKNIETAYRFMSRIETWQPSQLDLFSKDFQEDNHDGDTKDTKDLWKKSKSVTLCWQQISEIKRRAKASHFGLAALWVSESLAIEYDGDAEVLRFEAYGEAKWDDIPEWIEAIFGDEPVVQIKAGGRGRPIEFLPTRRFTPDIYRRMELERSVASSR